MSRLTSLHPRRFAPLFVLAAALLVGACDAVAPATQADLAVSASDGSTSGDVRCRGTLGAVTVRSITVPAGRTCVLNGTRVRRNVDVGAGATLVASGVRVGGNVQGNDAAAVTLGDLNGVRSTVAGNVQARDGGNATVEMTDIGGGLQVQQNAGAVVIADNTVGGNAQVDQNTGGVQIDRNLIEDTLSCQDNAPPPAGAGNVAERKEGQCGAL